KSLERLTDIGMLERVNVVLDFSEIKTLLVSYRQIINFRAGLHALPPKKIRRIAVINHSNDTLIDKICSSTGTVEGHVLNADLQCFQGNSGSYIAVV
ncbi:MAG: hypothetical protein P8X39_09840, partial [Desulfofustis sp.]